MQYARGQAPASSGGGGSGGIVSINADSTPAQLIVAAATGTDFTVSTAAGTTTIAIPSASATARGLITTASQTIAGTKTFSSNVFFSTNGTGIDTVSGGGLGIGLSNAAVINIGSSTSDTQLFGASEVVAAGTFKFNNVTASLPLKVDASKFVTSAAINLSGAEVTGTLAAARMPALTGDVTSSAGTVATTAAATQANIQTLSRTAGVAVHGTNTNDSAAAGYVGQYITSTIATGSAIHPTTAVATNVASISLTAGDWDVTGVMAFDSESSGGTGSSLIGGISTVSATQGTVGDTAVQTSLYPPDGVDTVVVLPTTRVSINSTTSVYLVTTVVFDSGTLAVFGRISARRIR